MEAAIPISILVIGLARLRAADLLENDHHRHRRVWAVARVPSLHAARTLTS
jgi:hypothetical protein